jgi:hypothetical protein
MHAQRFIASSAAKALIILYERTLVTAASPIAPNIFQHRGSNPLPENLATAITQAPGK